MELCSEISYIVDPGESWDLFHPLNISHTDLFYNASRLLFLMVTIAIKQTPEFGANHLVGGLKEALTFPWKHLGSWGRGSAQARRLQWF